MADEKRKLADLLRAEPPAGPAVPGHLTLKGILGDLGAELRHQAGAGAHELGAALLRNYDGFVMYPRQEGTQPPSVVREQATEREL